MGPSHELQLAARLYPVLQLHVYDPMVLHDTNFTTISIKATLVNFLKGTTVMIVNEYHKFLQRL